MHNHRIILLFIVMSAWLHPASAQPTNRIEMRDVTVDRVKSREHREDENRRQQWGLSPKEWARYKILMQGIRGSISPATISPIEVLGTHARNNQERRKYAELWAQMRHEDIGRVLAFQRAYDEAFDKLYGDEKLIDVSKLDIPRPWTFGANDRILLFQNHALPGVRPYRSGNPARWQNANRATGHLFHGPDNGEQSG